MEELTRGVSSKLWNAWVRESAQWAQVTPSPSLAGPKRAASTARPTVPRTLTVKLPREKMSADRISDTQSNVIKLWRVAEPDEEIPWNKG